MRERRHERAIERIRKVLRDRDSLIRARENLNNRWTELTGDTEAICQELCLKASAKIFIL